MKKGLSSRKLQRFKPHRMGTKSQGAEFDHAGMRSTRGKYKRSRQRMAKRG